MVRSEQLTFRVCQGQNVEDHNCGALCSQFESRCRTEALLSITCVSLSQTAGGGQMSRTPAPPVTTTISRFGLK